MTESYPNPKQKLLESHRILESVLYSKNKNWVKFSMNWVAVTLRWRSGQKQFNSVDKALISWAKYLVKPVTELMNELIKLSELQFELFNSNQSVEQSIKEANNCLKTTSKAIKLLNNYSVPSDDEDSPQMKEMNNLEERLVFLQFGLLSNSLKNNWI